VLLFTLEIDVEDKEDVEDDSKSGTRGRFREEVTGVAKKTQKQK